MKHIRQHVAQRKVVWANKIVVTYNDHKICRKLPVNETPYAGEAGRLLQLGKGS
jgi:hypothetical protein